MLSGDNVYGNLLKILSRVGVLGKKWRIEGI